MDAHITGQKVGYARVSSVGQRLDRQVVAIGEVDRLFTDEVSGRSRSDRPGLSAALSWVRAGDELRVASMDRLARSLVDLESIVDELVQRGVAVTFVKERMTFTADASDPFATFQRQLIGAVAELERSLIRERQREGIELAKARGAYRGRVRRLTEEQVKHARDRVEAGAPKAAVARDLSCSRRTLYDALSGRGVYAPAPLNQPRNN
ncbi:resolvase, N-terminal domain protein [Dermacoccus sp. Ellin185]|nr:resolvase, N-terminal domain protein [Dermacoccus sp. Ellin185]